MKLLLVGIFDDTEPQSSLREALDGIADTYVEFNHSSHRNKVNYKIELEFRKHNFDVIFMQIQQSGVVDVALIKKYHSQGVKIFNFTGDVRQPIPAWYYGLAPYVTTLFTNKTDSDLFTSQGYRSAYFQIGYNTEYYNTIGPKADGPEIVFMGNNYKDLFPLSKLRAEMVDMLRKRYGSRFGVYGNGWPNTKWLRQHHEASIYRNCKIAINLSHFDLSCYSSDRLFRILGCGAFCASHQFTDIEKEFTIGTHLTAWKTLDQLCELIDLYLLPENDGQRQQIAVQGNYLCQTHYTWEYRIKHQLLPLIKNETLD